MYYWVDIHLRRNKFKKKISYHYRTRFVCELLLTFIVLIICVTLWQSQKRLLNFVYIIVHSVNPLETVCCPASEGLNRDLLVIKFPT